MLASQPAKAGDYGFNYITKGGRIVLKDSTMMHEMRQTPSYYNKNEGVSNLTHPHFLLYTSSYTFVIRAVFPFSLYFNTESSSVIALSSICAVRWSILDNI